MIPLVDGNRFATRLHVLALARTDQGRRMTDGRRLSDLVMESFISDAVAIRTTGILTAIAACDHLKSIALCERNGLVSQVRHGLDYVRLTGWFAAE